MKILYTVIVAPGLRYDCEASEDLELKADNEVILQLERCKDNGSIRRIRPGRDSLGEKEDNNFEGEQTDRRDSTKGSKNVKDGGKRRDKNDRNRAGRKEEKNAARILRIINEEDKNRIRENKNREVSMLRTAVRKVKEHNLQMKILNCHYTYDRSMVFFQFVADGRVDFRNLVRDLSGALHVRVELRQVGVRDEASLVGGIGCCGRPFCCATILNKFPAVNVKTAKEQRLSLNPSTVSGSCGRLKCCLRYELEGYREMNKSLPRINSRCRTCDGSGKVVDCNALTRSVRVRLDDNAERFIDLSVDELYPEK